MNFWCLFLCWTLNKAKYRHVWMRLFTFLRSHALDSTHIYHVARDKCHRVPHWVTYEYESHNDQLRSLIFYYVMRNFILYYLIHVKIVENIKVQVRNLKLFSKVKDPRIWSCTKKKFKKFQGCSYIFQNKNFEECRFTYFMNILYYC